jgi:hypothetical protein
VGEIYADDLNGDAVHRAWQSRAHQTAKESVAVATRACGDGEHTETADNNGSSRRGLPCELVADNRRPLTPQIA